MEKKLSERVDLIFQDGKLHGDLENEWDDIYREMALKISDTIEEGNRIAEVNKDMAALE